MSTIAPTQPTVSSPPPLAAPALHRFTVDEYERLGAGVLAEPNRVELIDGYVVDKMPKDPEHSYATKQALKALENRLPAGWTARKEEPVRMPACDEPEPDVAIIRGSDADYQHRLPTAADVVLVVEVSESTPSLDRGPKLSIYGRDRIPVYWIINLVDRQVEVCVSPDRSGYRSRKAFLPGQHIPVVIGGQGLRPIAVDEILPS